MPDVQYASRPVIGIVPSFSPDNNTCTVRENYTSSVIAAGGIPVILPLTSDTTVYERLFPLIDGFVLTGGQDIDPARYGCIDLKGVSDEHTPTREEVECLILSYAYQFDIPVLGICRGMQMINVFFGGTLYLDLAEAFTETSDGSKPAIAHWQHEDYGTPSHFVSIVRASKLGQIINTDTLATNSMHHQGVRDLGPLLDAAAYGPDGLVEAIEVRDRTFILGVQWHPEFFGGAKQMGCLFSSLVCEAGKIQKRKCPSGLSTTCATCTTCKPRSCQPQKACPAIPTMLTIIKADDDELWPSITFADCI